MAESEEELKSLLMKVKVEGEKVGLFPSSPEMITTLFVNWLYPNRNLKK